MINTIIVNDDLSFLNKLKRLVSKKEELNLIDDYKNPVRCLDQLKKDERKLELIILAADIMGYSGLDVAKHIHKLDNKIKIVFTASSKKYAAEAFELNALDYLVWPVLEKRFAKTIERLKNDLLK